ncbi:peptidase A26, partial [bacterium]|nr:peptidase A26 [bacterium]
MTGWDTIGGLVGRSSYGSVSNSFATGAVSGGGQVGGLVGGNWGSIASSYATGNVSVNFLNGLVAGGLAGYTFGSISDSFATGDVGNATSAYIGGLVGRLIGGTLTNVFATGTVLGSESVGKLAGDTSATGVSINNTALTIDSK